MKEYHKRRDAKLKELRKSGSKNKITPNDVEFSLKRLMVLNTSTQSNISDFICDSKKIKNINESCSGMKTTDNEIIFELENEKMIPQFLNALATLDTKIVPREAVNDKLEIIDFSVTTGLYSVESFNSDLILKINKSHPRYKQDYPLGILYFDYAPQTADTLFLNIS